MKGILFKPWKHKAIRENPDREWQTRRLAGLKEINKEPNNWMCVGTDGLYWGFEMFAPDPEEYHRNIKPCYQVGETVYIREAWATENQYNDLKPREIPHTAKIFYLLDGNYDPFKMGRIRSPLFMMGWMARDFIKITDVRPERLQEITEEDAIKEGIIFDKYSPHIYPWALDGIEVNQLYKGKGYYIEFHKLWDSINPKYPWASNPFIWRYEFKKEVKEC